MKNNQKKILLKDELFNKQKVTKLAIELKSIYTDFKKEEFIKDVILKFDELELKQRISWITECLKKYLPSQYKKAVLIILKALPKENNPSLLDNDFGDFIYAPYSDFVAKYGCNKKNFEFSLNALKQITKRFSAEDAIRYFINAYPKQTISILQNWSKDENYHIRRLCSEGTRPKLPWSQKINIQITEPIKILNNLFYDKTRFVTRSVANHINDISKIEPNLTIQILDNWQKLQKQNLQEMKYIILHSLRTLIKNGNKKAFEFIGINNQPNIKILKFQIPKKVFINTFLEFSFILKAKENTNIIVDYIIYFQNKSKKANSKKVFKLKKCFINKNQKITIYKKHLLKQNMTTRKIYLGIHYLEIQINGIVVKRKNFEVIQ